MIACFFLGMFCGGVVITTVARVWMIEQELWHHERLDYWANRVTELQEHLNDLQRREDDRDTSGEEWKNADD